MEHRGLTLVAQRQKTKPPSDIVGNVPLANREAAAICIENKTRWMTLPFEPVAPFWITYNPLDAAVLTHYLKYINSLAASRDWQSNDQASSWLGLPSMKRVARSSSRVFGSRP